MRRRPLALLEIPRLLSPEQLAGAVPLQQPVPVGEKLLGAYASGFEQLPDRCRHASLIASLLEEPDPRLLQLALAEGECSVADLAEAEDAGLIELTPLGGWCFSFFATLRNDDHTL